MFDKIKKGAKAISYFLIVIWILLGCVAIPLFVLMFDDSVFAIVISLMGLIAWVGINSLFLVVLTFFKNVWGEQLV